tara:strand:+ start:158 stop:1423 length:1266 start_codon:yes stop_codon:yes gene_type:complete
MYEVLTGKQRSLVFPIMCNAFVKMDYSDNVPNTGNNLTTEDDVGYGIWAHKGSFTFEALITPYEINGNNAHQAAVALGVNALGVGNVTTNLSKKIMSGLPQSTYSLSDGEANDETEMQNDLYLSRSNRQTHEMMIFNNDNFKISLLNATNTTQNQPAQYKIKVDVKLGPSLFTKTVTSDVVIAPSQGHTFRYNATNGSNLFDGFNSKGRVMYAKVATTHSSSSGAMAEGGNTFTLASATHPIHGNQQDLYVRSGFTFTSLGVVGSVSGADITLSVDGTRPAVASGTDIYLPTYKHPSYIDQMFHVGCVFNDRTERISLYLNGVVIKEETHQVSTTIPFEFSKTDTYIGSNGLNDMTTTGITDAISGGSATGPTAATTCKQFMGEFHEMCISNRIKNISEIDNLMPTYNDALLYLRFEEVDL